MNGLNSGVKNIPRNTICYVILPPLAPLQLYLYRSRFLNLFRVIDPSFIRYINT